VNVDTKRLVALMLVVFLASSCLTQEKKDVDQRVDTKITATEYEIYSVVLNDLLQSAEHNNKKISQIVLEDKTSTGMPPGAFGMTGMNGEDIQELRGAVTKELRDAFQTENQTNVSTLSASDLKCKKRCVVVEQKRINGFFEKDGGHWEGFYKSFPESQGITLVSRIGFGPSGDLALVYIGTMSSGLGGAGQFILLEKRQNLWTIKNKGVVWVS
jgi:hypothetical protein